MPISAIPKPCRYADIGTIGKIMFGDKPTYRYRQFGNNAERPCRYADIDVIGDIYFALFGNHVDMTCQYSDISIISKLYFADVPKLATMPIC